MTRSDAFREVVRDACTLIKQSAGSRKKILVSPEVADWLERVEVSVAATAPDPVVRESASSYDSSSGVDKGLQPLVSGVADDTGLSGVASLEELEQIVRTCTKCPLAKTRTQTVFGTGNSHGKLVFVGEAPGHDEDVQGKPFVGRAGQLLTDIIEKGMKLKRSDVFICNVLKCRPPENRNPLPHEVECCEPFLIRQLELIQPRVICALGAYAAQTLLKTTETIGRLRGKWHFYHGIPLRATYHPAYLLRSPGEKRKTWEDVLEVLKVYNGECKPEP